MGKIKIENNQFICPMIEETISERGEINYGYCRKCKFNILGQFIDNFVYCHYGETNHNGSSSQSEFNPEMYWEEYQQ